MEGPLAPFADAYALELRRHGFMARSTVGELRQVEGVRSPFDDRGDVCSPEEACLGEFGGEPGEIRTPRSFVLWKSRMESLRSAGSASGHASAAGLAASIRSSASGTPGNSGSFFSAA